MAIRCILLALLFASCKTISLTERYQRAVMDAMYPTEEKVQSQLIAITESNNKLIRKTIKGEEYILAVSWKAKNYYPDSGRYNTKDYEIWVTTAPELLQRIAGIKPQRRQMRLNQLLGLPPEARYQYFIEFWVRPADLFRPCPDKEITDSRCNICFTTKDSLDMAHIKWINNFRLAAYYSCGLPNQYPWTELGYTYDWSPRNKSHKGCSEFVIRKNSEVYVNHVYTNDAYFNRKY